MRLSKLLSPPPLPRSDEPIMSLQRKPAKLSPWQRRDLRPRPSVRSIGEPGPRPPRLCTAMFNGAYANDPKEKMVLLRRTIVVIRNGKQTPARKRVIELHFKVERKKSVF